MFPNNPSYDTTLKKLLAACHKETQTSNASLKDNCIGTPSGNINTNDKGSLKVFEFSELVQDPKHPRDITIIKDVYAEEIHDHNSPSGSASDDAIANRYTYCREVIKPYLKDYPKDCPVSDDQLIRDALNAAQEDFPDYEPCFEGYDGSPNKSPGGGKGALDKDQSLEFFGIKEGIHDHYSEKIKSSPSKTPRSSITDDSSSKSSLSKKDKATSKSTCSSKDSKIPSQDSDKDIKNTSQICFNKDKVKTWTSTEPNTLVNLGNTSKTSMSNMDPDDVCSDPGPPKKRDKRCPKKDPCPPSLEPCFDKDPCAPGPGPPEICQNKTPNQEGTSRCKTPSPATVSPCPDNTQEPIKKTCEQPPHDIRAASPEVVYAQASVTSAQSERKKTMIEAHGETIATIKTAVEDFFGKVYKSTKDAVTVIKTESARHLGRMTAKKSNSSDMVPQKVHDNKSSDTLTNFSFFRGKSDIKKDEDTMSAHLEKAGQAIGKIFEKVDSTISVVSDNLEKVASVIQFDTDKSSPYDKVSNMNEELEPASTSLPGSVFTAIKSRIVSMFSEEIDKDLRRNSDTSTDSSSSKS